MPPKDTPMAINLEELRARPLDPEIDEEIVRFEGAVDEYLAGDLDEDVFRVSRLNQGIYGQRQGGTNQMVRVKIPYGRVEPEQLEMLASISERYSRGWGHLTTRQNVQFHFVELRDTPEVLRLLGVGRAHQPRGVRRHRAQRRRLPPRRRVPLRGARHLAVGRSRLPMVPPQPALAAAAAQVQDQLQRLRDRLRPGDVQRRRRHRVSPVRSPTAPPSRVPGVPRRWARGEPAPGAGARGVHEPRGPARHDRGDPADLRPLSATATTSCGRA